MNIKYCIVILSITIACNQPKNKNEMPNQALPLQNPNVVVSAANQFLLNKLLEPKEKDFRGFQFGDNRQKILSEENFSQFEESEKHIGFTFDSPNLETIDVLYYFDANDALERIQVDVYVNSEKVQAELEAGLKDYFSNLHGTAQTQIGTLLWRDVSSVIKLQAIHSKLDKGIKLEIEPVL